MTNLAISAKLENAYLFWYFTFILHHLNFQVHFWSYKLGLAQDVWRSLWHRKARKDWKKNARESKMTSIIKNKNRIKNINVLERTTNRGNILKMYVLWTCSTHSRHIWQKGKNVSVICSLSFRNITFSSAEETWVSKLRSEWAIICHIHANVAESKNGQDSFQPVSL